MLAPHVTVDLTEFRALVGRTQAQLGNACEDVANDGGDAAVEHAKAQPNFRDRTGGLRRSIAVTDRAHFDGRRAICTAQARTGYAAHVEFGTRPHIIEARRVPNLVFYWERMGYWFIGKRVHHPGTDGRFYMSRGARAAHYAMLRRWQVVAPRIGRIWS